ncbi:rifin, partial [Plasmodium reichenowi]
FALPLNILVTLYHAHNKNKPYITTQHTPKITITRLLCECDLYMPNYDNDPQMKAVMQQFEDRTSQRFHEYDDRMIEKRKHCKDKCDKEIQKIILKDKLEKQMEQQLTTLQTDIQNDGIPTCVCEKSLADKMEKNCMKCTQNVGGIVAPSAGVLAGIAEGALYAWKPLALEAAKEAAKQAGIAAGKAAGEAAGKKAVILGLQTLGVKDICPELLKSIGIKIPYNDVGQISNAIFKKYEAACLTEPGSKVNGAMCSNFNDNFGLLNHETGALYGEASTEITNTIKTLVGGIKGNADAKAAGVTADKTPIFTTRNIDAVNTTYGSCQTAITASIIAIVVIILIMVIIYLILRYRRKKKMKKKLQYIKLLEE